MCRRYALTAQNKDPKIEHPRMTEWLGSVGVLASAEQVLRNLEGWTKAWDG